MNSQTEQFRRQCEARQWLDWGYTTGLRVDELIKNIRKKRGQEAANELRTEMRIQWKKRQ